MQQIRYTLASLPTAQIEYYPIMPFCKHNHKIVPIIATSPCFKVEFMPAINQELSNQSECRRSYQILVGERKREISQKLHQMHTTANQ
jgi:hypothetical protein